MGWCCRGRAEFGSEHSRDAELHHHSHVLHGAQQLMSRCLVYEMFLPRGNSEVDSMNADLGQVNQGPELAGNDSY